jgi:hypothetical protein
MDNWLINIADEFFLALEKTIENWKPEITIENDGIGPYEYWGAKGFDKGHDYPVVEEYEDTHYVDLERPVAQRLIKKVVEDLNSTIEELTGAVYVDYDKGKYEVVEFKVDWKVVKIENGINAVKFDIEYTDVEG